MGRNQDNAIKAFGLLSEKLLSLKRLPSAKYVEEAKEQYQSFIKHVVTAEFEKFESFDKFQQRVDEFLGTFLLQKTYCNVYDILKLVCTLSHGQYCIERGFSINKEHLIENLQEESLMALRTVNDHMLSNNLTPVDIQITKGMMDNVKSSRNLYMAALEDRKKAKLDDAKSRKRKQLSEQIDEIAKKKKVLMSSIDKDIERSDVLSLQAEAEKDFSILHTANSLKDLVKKKREELNTLSREEKQLKEKTLL